MKGWAHFNYAGTDGLQYKVETNSKQGRIYKDEWEQHFIIPKQFDHFQFDELVMQLIEAHIKTRNKVVVVKNPYQAGKNK